MTVSEYIGKFIAEALEKQVSGRQEIVIFDGEDKYKTIFDNYHIIDNENIPINVLVKEIGTPIVSKAIKRVTLITKA